MAEAVAAAIADVVELWRIVRGDLGASVIQQTFLHTEYPLFGNLDGAVPAAPRALTDALNQALREAAAREGVALLDIAHWAEAHGRDAWFDAVRWHHAKQQMHRPPRAFYGDLVGRLLAALRGRSSKCLVLDLDNTLWGGVIGDDGLEASCSARAAPLGEAFLGVPALRAHAVAARHHPRGLLEERSQRSPASRFEHHPEMVLKRADIAVLRRQLAATRPRTSATSRRS